MTPKDPFLEGTFWDKFWRPIRSRALLFTPEERFRRFRFPVPVRFLSHPGILGFPEKGRVGGGRKADEGSF